MSKFKTFRVNNILYCFEFLILDFGPEASGCNLKFIIWCFICKNF